ncbi:MAG: DUF7009 family protein [Chloroherpetonaceae bacterium]
MKLRIKGNTLRLRLSKSEVAKIGSEGYVEDAIHFAGNTRMTYAMKVSDVPSLSATMENCTITVYLPKALANTWVETEQVGFEAHQPLDNGESLYILVEKDFQCLAPRPNEDESDNYAHPPVEVGHKC